MRNRLLSVLGAGVALMLSASASAEMDEEAYHQCLSACQSWGNSYGFCYQECYRLYGEQEDDGERGPPDGYEVPVPPGNARIRRRVVPGRDRLSRTAWQSAGRPPA